MTIHRARVVPRSVCNQHGQSHTCRTRPGPCARLRLLTVRAMLRDGMDSSTVVAATGIPRALVQVMLTLELDSH
jgi:hypothetical protein